MLHKVKSQFPRSHYESSVYSHTGEVWFWYIQESWECLLPYVLVPYYGTAHVIKDTFFVDGSKQKCTGCSHSSNENILLEECRKFYYHLLGQCWQGPKGSSCTYYWRKYLAKFSGISEAICRNVQTSRSKGCRTRMMAVISFLCKPSLRWAAQNNRIRV